MSISPFNIDVNEEFQHLDSSPIVEAVIHWAARSSKPLEESILREELSSRLPCYPHIQSQHRQQIEATLRPGMSTYQRVNEGWHGLRLTSEDKLFVVQFTREGVVFSRLEPYHNWDEFSEQGIQIWKHYCEIAEEL